VASGHGSDTILIGETAPRGRDHPIGDFSGVKPLRFLRALYCVDAGYRELRGQAARARGCPAAASGSRGFRTQHPALFNASGFADHPYEQGVPPDTPTYACGARVCWSSHPGKPASDPDYADLPEVPRLERVLDRLNRVYGSGTRFPVYSTEYGYWTRPPDAAATIGPSTAAYYMNWAEYLSWREPRLRSYDQYLLLDPRKGNFASGLELPDRRPKPTFDAYRLPIFLPVTSLRHGRRLEVWGCVRPAHFAQLDSRARRQVRIEFASGARGTPRPIGAVTITNPAGYFDVRLRFPGSGSVRLAWAYPSGRWIHSRTVRITS
jgi:hypothetical protein